MHETLPGPPKLRKTRLSVRRLRCAFGETQAHHEQLVEELKQKIEDTKGEIADKQQGIKDTMESIQTADKESRSRGKPSDFHASSRRS